MEIDGEMSTCLIFLRSTIIAKDLYSEPDYSASTTSIASDRMRAANEWFDIGRSIPLFSAQSTSLECDRIHSL